MVDTHNQEVGLIGAGHIGLQLCRHLLARGYRVLAFDVAPAACASASDLGASVASSVGEVGARSSHVLLSLPGSEAVEDVVLSEGGLGLTMPPGSLLIDTSSSRPTSTRRMPQSFPSEEYACSTRRSAAVSPGRETQTLP
jgi:3-hydroxyisobutyrate dehydrogenase